MAPLQTTQIIQITQITGIILAGGRASRMGGVDKGLQPFHGVPLALHALRRLAPQVGHIMLNANRHLATYQTFGAPVLPDDTKHLGEYAGPLAGFITGLTHCPTPYLLTVPCDTPLFPHDLAARLAQALVREKADIAIATAREEDGQLPLRPQPVFCLLAASLRESLLTFTQHGGRKIQTWIAQHHTVAVPFDQQNDEAHSFFNANTLLQLHQLESLLP